MPTSRVGFMKVTSALKAAAAAGLGIRRISGCEVFFARYVSSLHVGCDDISSDADIDR